MVESNRKCWNLIENLTFLIKFDEPLIKFDHFRYKFEVRFEFGPRFWIVVTISMDFSNKFGLKMSIKMRFEYHLDWFFGTPRSNRISLHCCADKAKWFCCNFFQNILWFLYLFFYICISSATYYKILSILQTTK